MDIPEYHKIQSVNNIKQFVCEALNQTVEREREIDMKGTGRLALKHMNRENVHFNNETHGKVFYKKMQRKSIE